MESLSRRTAEIVLNIYFLELGAVLFSLLFGNSGFYGFLYKILLFG